MTSPSWRKGPFSPPAVPKEIASDERVREAYLGRPEDEDYVEEAAHA